MGFGGFAVRANPLETAHQLTPVCRLRSSLRSSLRPTLGPSRRLQGKRRAVPAGSATRDVIRKPAKAKEAAHLRR